VSTVASDGRANLTVVNDGPRVSQAEAETLTTPFRRLGAGRTGSDGFGLGVSIADSVARAHGGTLTIRARGRGLAVTVELPATAGDPALERAPTVVR
jgi:signal transduction histidine kinase